MKLLTLGTKNKIRISKREVLALLTDISISNIEIQYCCEVIDVNGKANSVWLNRIAIKPYITLSESEVKFVGNVGDVVFVNQLNNYGNILNINISLRSGTQYLIGTINDQNTINEKWYSYFELEFNNQKGKQNVK